MSKVMQQKKKLLKILHMMNCLKTIIQTTDTSDLVKKTNYNT